MAEVKAKTAYHHGDLRQQLVAATRTLVEAKGPDLFSVSEACRAAGVSTAAPYKHFADRTEMPVTALGVAYVTYAEANPGMVKMMFAGDHKTEELEAAGACCYAVVLGQMAARLGKTELDAAVYQAGFPLWTFEHGLAFLRIDDKAEFARIETPLTDLVGMATRRLLSDPT